MGPFRFRGSTCRCLMRVFVVFFPCVFVSAPFPAMKTMLAIVKQSVLHFFLTAFGVSSG